LPEPGLDDGQQKQVTEGQPVLESELPEPSLDEKEEWKSWEHIPDKKSDRKIVELWCKGLNAREINKEVFLQDDTIHNIISNLRKSYPGAQIPKDAERKEKMRSIMR